MKLNGYIFIACGLLNILVNGLWLCTGDRPNFYMRGGMGGFWLTTALGGIFVMTGLTLVFFGRRKH